MTAEIGEVSANLGSLLKNPYVLKNFKELAGERQSFEGLIFELGHLWEELNGNKIVLVIPLSSHSNSGEFSALT